jgi:hypothetical protein
MLTRKDRKRLAEINHQLARLSRNGWQNAIPADYVPLEKELLEIIGRDLGDTTHH